MSEKAKYLDLVNSNLDSPIQTWQKFPPLLRPDVQSFRKGLVIGEIPRRLKAPQYYFGLKHGHRSLLEEGQRTAAIPADIYTDPVEGKTYISERLIKSSNNLAEVLTFQVAIYNHLKGIKFYGIEKDRFEHRAIQKYLPEVCNRIPSPSEIFIIKRGFSLEVYYDDGTRDGQLIMMMGPPTPKKSKKLDLYDHIDSLYPHVLTLFTRLVKNRGGDINQLTADISGANYQPKDFTPYNYNSFSMRLYRLMHQTKSRPWKVLEAVDKSDTFETEMALHESLIEPTKVNLLEYLLEGIRMDNTK